MAVIKVWDENNNQWLTVSGTGSSSSTSSVSTNEITYVPEALEEDNAINAGVSIETFLNASSNKKILFPKGKLYTLEQAIIVHDISNVDIDFNGCTLKLPNNCNFPSRSDGSMLGVYNVAICFNDCNNIKISNYIIEGNKANIAAEEDCIGMRINDTSIFESYNGVFQNCNYHSLWIESDYYDIKFYNTLSKNHGGVPGLGCSDIYVSHDSDECNFLFKDTYIENTALVVTQQNQAFYISGGNGIIENVYAVNCKCVIDIRSGHHIINNITLINGYCIFMVQVTPNEASYTGDAVIQANNLIGKNLIGDQFGGATGIYINSCEKCDLTNIDIEMNSTATYAWYGLRIRDTENKPVKNFTASNIRITGPTTNGIAFGNLQYSSILKNVVIDGKIGGSTYAVRSDDCTAAQYIENLTYSNCSGKYTASGSDGMVRFKGINGGNAVSLTTTIAQSEYFTVGEMFYDITLSKPSWCSAVGNRELDTLIISTGATSSGNVTTTLNGVAFTTAVTAGDTAVQVADKIRNTYFTNFYPGGTVGTTTVTFQKSRRGTCSAPSFSGGTTGVTATSFTRTVTGSNNTLVTATVS